MKVIVFERVFSGNSQIVSSELCNSVCWGAGHLKGAVLKSVDLKVKKSSCEERAYISFLSKDRLFLHKWCDLQIFIHVTSAAGSQLSTTLTVNSRTTWTQNPEWTDVRCQIIECSVVCTSLLLQDMGLYWYILCVLSLLSQTNIQILVLGRAR